MHERCTVSSQKVPYSQGQALHLRGLELPILVLDTLHAQSGAEIFFKEKSDELAAVVG